MEDKNYLAKSEDSMIEMQSTTELTVAYKDADQDLIEPCGGPVGELVMFIRRSFFHLFNLNPKTLTIIKKLTILVVLLAYLVNVFARWINSNCTSVGWRDGYGFLFILVCIVTFYIIYRNLITRVIGRVMGNLDDSKLHKIKRGTRWSYYIFLGIVVILFLVFSIQDAVNEPRRFISLAGYFSILFLAFLFSKHPNYVRWDIIARGISLHFLLALIFVKWPLGREILSVISEHIINFLEYAFVGARFVYGTMLIDLGVFIFKSLSVLFFLAMIINVLFYYGILQSTFKNLGHMIQLLLGTTIIESSNSVASVFLGMSEAPLLFKPYLIDLTASEIHAIMTSGFATVAGTVLAAYVSFGADPAILICASAMAAPASLTLSKLFYPEIQRTKTSIKNLVLHKSEDANAVDAACKGAMLGCQLVPAIAANVLSFVSFVACFNALLTWLGRLAGIPDLTFERIIGLVFVPLAWLMGVSPPDIVDVAKLIGIKTVVNEFIGYKELGVLKNANKLSVRSEAIATYAMCGFANPGSVAIFVSSLLTVCPERRETVTQVALRAFVAGSFSSFLSASLAGFLTPENGFETENSAYSYNNYTLSNDTSCYFFSW